MGQSPSSTYVSDDEVGLPFLQGNAEFGAIFPTSRWYCSQPKKTCEPGDILISVRAPVGALNKADQKYVIGRGLAAVRFCEVAPDFGWHLLRYWARDLDRVAQGTTFKAVSRGDLNALEVLLPPQDEQLRIAWILDTADEAIRRSERVIAKLREVKKGLLHDLLTRGLDADGNLRDPDAHPEQFKDSPLGRIPREWQKCQLSDLVAFIRSGLSRAITFEDIGLPVITSTNIVEDRLDISELKFWHVDDPQGAATEEYILDNGDILVNFINSIAQIGKSCLFHDIGRPAIYTTNIFRVRPSSRVDSKFLWRMLQSDHVQSRIQEITKPAINQASFTQGDFLSIPIAVPKPPEQDRIAAMLDAHDARIRAEEATLGKLRQVKRGLMDDLLTGRVRVGRLPRM
jgi:type I restriction enzyme S subunit